MTKGVNRVSLRNAITLAHDAATRRSQNVSTARHSIALVDCEATPPNLTITSPDASDIPNASLQLFYELIYQGRVAGNPSESDRTGLPGVTGTSVASPDEWDDRASQFNRQTICVSLITEGQMPTMTSHAHDTNAGADPGRRVRNALLGLRYHECSDLLCEANGATVTIKGNLPSYHLKQMAQIIAMNVPGVRNVVNEITVCETDPTPR